MTLEEPIVEPSEVEMGAAIGPSAVPYQSLYMAAAQPYGLDWKMLAGQGFAESAFDPNAVSHAGAQGIAQFMPGTWAEWGKGGNPFNPEDAIPAQAAYMNWIVEYMKKRGKSQILFKSGSAPFRKISVKSSKRRMSPSRTCRSTRNGKE